MLLILKTLFILRVFRAKLVNVLINLPLMPNKNFLKPRTSDVLYILGCGSSVNDLSDRQIDLINKSDSIGINLFIVHELIKPSYYSVEVVDSGHDDKVKNSQMYCTLLKEKTVRNKNLKFIATLESWSTVKRIIPDILKYGEVNLVQQVGIPGRSVKHFSKLHQFAISRSIKKLLSPEMTFGKNASVVSLVYFGILRGYKNIVLCGVDLSAEYFWEGKSGALKYPGCKDFINMHKSNGINHKTDLTPLPVSCVLSSINNSDCGTKLWVGTSSSKLSGKLPVFPFTDQYTSQS